MKDTLMWYAGAHVELSKMPTPVLNGVLTIANSNLALIQRTLEDDEIKGNSVYTQSALQYLQCATVWKDILEFEISIREG